MAEAEQNITRQPSLFPLDQELYVDSSKNPFVIPSPKADRVSLNGFVKEQIVTQKALTMFPPPDMLMHITAATIGEAGRTWRENIIVESQQFILRTYEPPAELETATKTAEQGLHGNTQTSETHHGLRGLIYRRLGRNNESHAPQTVVSQELQTQEDAKPNGRLPDGVRLRIEQGEGDPDFAAQRQKFLALAKIETSAPKKAPTDDSSSVDELVGSTSVAAAQEVKDTKARNTAAQKFINSSLSTVDGAAIFATMRNTQNVQSPSILRYLARFRPRRRAQQAI